MKIFSIRCTIYNYIREKLNVQFKRYSFETIKMIQEENLDIRTITMGISLLDCIDSDIDKSCEKVLREDDACCGASR